MTSVLSGLTNTGYIATTVDAEVNDLNAKLLANVAGGLDLAPDQPFGQIVSIFAEKFAELTELGATVYSATNPAGAQGALLVNLASISGTHPQVATYSKATVNLMLTAGATVSAGAVVAVLNQPSNTWVLLANATNSGGVTAAIPATFRSSLPGPFVAPAGSITVINTPAIGLLSVTNPADAVPGLSADTDTTLRQRRALQLAGQGSGDTAAIRAAVLKVSGVLQAFCFENTSLLPDSTGLPGKAFRVVVWDGPGLSASNTAIATAIWQSKPSGIQSYGQTAQVIVGSDGNNYTVFFDRAAQRRLYVSCTTTPASLTTAGTAAVKTAIYNYALAAFNLGVSVIALPFRAAAIVPTINTDVPTFTFDFVPSPINTANLTVSGLQIATLSSTDILVNGL